MLPWITNRKLVSHNELALNDTENQKDNLALNRPITPESHNTGANEAVISPSILDDSVLIANNNPNLSICANTPEDFIVC